MEKQSQLNRISVLLARFVAGVEVQGAMGFTDLFKIAEDILIPLLKPVFELSTLENLNTSHHSNFPAIDLGAKNERIAIQVTATPDSEKIKKTLETFVRHNLHEDYDTLYVYLLKTKRSSYPVKKIQQITSDKLNFHPKNNIIDHNDLARWFSEMTSLQLDPILMHLERQFGDSRKKYYSRLQDEHEVETVYLNMMEVSFPGTLYIAELDIERDEIIRSSWDTEYKLKMVASDQQVVRSALRQAHASYRYEDWVVHNNQIITFDDLNATRVGLRKIIDQGTIAELDPKEYYGANENLQRVFSYLLSRCLEERLYGMHIRRQYEDNLFIYFALDSDQEDRTESWSGSSSATRKVFEKTMDRDDPEKLWYAKHFAFKPRFHLIERQWYMTVRPDWFFTWNGWFRKYSRSSDKVDWLKRRERNADVFTHFRFIHNQLLASGQPNQSNMFEEELSDMDDPQTEHILHFGRIVSFNSAPLLPDKDWLHREPKEERALLTSQQELAFISRDLT